MPVDENKWSEIVSIILVYLQETLDELLLLQLNESKIINLFSRMYFDISRKDESKETKVLLEKIELFRENNRRIFVSTLDFLIAPLHRQIEILNQIIDSPSKDSKEKLNTAYNIQARSELFVKNLYQEEFEVISDYLSYKENQLQSFKDEKQRLTNLVQKTDSKKIEYLRDELSKLIF